MAKKNKAKAAPEFDITKPFSLLEGDVDIKEAAPQYDEGVSSTRLEAAAPVETFHAIEKAGQALDIPASVARRGVSDLIEGENPFTGMGDQIGNIAEHGLEGTLLAPRGSDIAGQIGIDNKIGKSVAGFGIDVLTDPTSLIPMRAATSSLRNILKSKSANQTAKVLQRYVPEGKYIKEAIDPSLLGVRLMEEDLIKYIGKPSLLYKKIAGGSLIKTKRFGNTAKITPKKIDSGLIGETAENITNQIKAISDDIPPVFTKDISVRASLAASVDMFSKTSGIPVDPSDIQKAEKLILGIMKKGDPDKIPTMNLSELLELKKNLNKQINSSLYYAPQDKAVALTKKTLMDLSGEIDSTIKHTIKDVNIPLNNGSINAANFYEAENNKLHHLLQLKSIMKSTPLKELKHLDIPQKIAEIAGASTAGVALSLGTGGSPMQAAASGAGFAMLNRSRHIGRERAPDLMAKYLDMTQRNIHHAPKIIPQAGRMLQDPLKAPRSRGGAGLNDITMNVDINKARSLPTHLSATTIPRDSAQIKDLAPLVLAKVAQEIPEAYAQVEDVLMNMPDRLPDIVPMLTNMMPEMFDYDKYQRFDNVVPMQMREKATRDIILDDNLSNTDRMKKLDLLNRTGELYDNMEEY